VVVLFKRLFIYDLSIFFRSLVNGLFTLFIPYKEKDKRLIQAIKTIVGSRPFNLEIYRLATQHISVAKETNGIKESNERLEFLGDAILGSVVAEYLFNKYPYRDEGFLTDIRSRIVSRESLNRLARKIGITSIIEYERNGRGGGFGSISHKSINGDTLEALIGAVYLDKGFWACRTFILKRLVLPHFDLDEVVKSNPNHKSRIIEWAQKNNKEIRFETSCTDENAQIKEFIAQVFIDDEPVCFGSGYSKKKAEQNASEKSCELLLDGEE
jgi:ribonuclease III